MNHIKLYRTIEDIASKRFENTEDLLIYVVEQIVANEDIRFTGSRIWKLSPDMESYCLINQTGDIEKIEQGFSVNTSEIYPSSENGNNPEKSKIHLNSLAGVGERIAYNGHYLYPFFLCFNSPSEFDESSGYSLSIISNAVSAVLRRDRAEAKTKLMEKDLDKAREIQKSISPGNALVWGDYEIYGMSQSDLVVGGDFYDYIIENKNNKNASIVIGDAVSKGLSAAIQALYVSGAIRMGAEFQDKIDILLNKLNNMVHRTFPFDRFVTLCYLDLRSDNGSIVYANAGHNNPIFYNHKNNSTQLLLSTGPPLGLLPDQIYKTEKVFLDVGDMVLLYTDGLSEAMNSNYDLYGEQKLCENLMAFNDQPAENICNQIIKDVINYNKNSFYSDDKTLVLIKKVR